MTILVYTLITPLGANRGKFQIPLHGVSDSWIPSLQNQGDEWQRLGQDGSGTQIVGTRGRKIQATGWNGCLSRSQAAQVAAAFESLETEVCQISDAWGRTLARVRLTEIKCTPKATRGPTAAGGQILYRVDCSWTAEMLPNA